MKDVSFGQYYPAVSFVHKMDARVKSEEPKIMSEILKTIYIALLTPSSVINPPSQRGVPFLLNTSCKIAESIIKNNTPFMLFSTLKNDILEKIDAVKINTKHSPKHR